MSTAEYLALHTTKCVLCKHYLFEHDPDEWMRCQHRDERKHWWSRKPKPCGCDMGLARS